MPDVTFDWLSADRLDELQAFVDGHWRRGHVLARDETLLRWQHRSAEPGRLSVLVAEHDGRIVGMLGFVCFTACLRGERLRGGWMTNWLVVPELRGRRLGAQLVERALEREFDLVGALGGNETTQRVLAGLGFGAQASMPRWVRVGPVDALADLLGARAAAYPQEAWRAWRAQEPAQPGERPEGVVAWSEESAASWNAVFSERFAPRLVGAWRDADHLRRRFLEHPVFAYEILVADAGVAVYRIEAVPETEHSIMRIVDFLAERPADDALAAALAEAADRAGVVFADFFCASERFGAPLERAGFAREDSLPATLPARFQPLDFSDRPLASSFWVSARVASSSRAYFDTEDLYVTRADSDLDRPN